VAGWRDIEKRGSLRERARTAGPLVGCFQRIPAATVTEVLAAAGLSFVIIDMEHTPVSLDRVAELVLASEAAGIDAVVRVPSADPVTIARTLETGCMGIQVPLVRSAAEAELAVRSTRFQPRGTRGLAAPRQTGYGAHQSLADWVAASEKHLLVVVQIEDRRGVADAEAIAAVDGVDVVFVGLTDLSHDLGVPGQFDAPPVTEALDRVRSATALAGKVLGLPATDLAGLERARSLGAAYLTMDDVRLLSVGAVQLLERIRGGG
jgi:2-dehydro-3-deoxyglucarate aldolase/4-hydroxy-2-oxoheptanedioate aldolase